MTMALYHRNVKARLGIIIFASILFLSIFGCSRGTETPKPAAPAKEEPKTVAAQRETGPIIFYEIYDQKSLKNVGRLRTTKTLVKGDLIFLEDDCYMVKMVKIRAREEKGKEPAPGKGRSYDTVDIQVWSQYLGKAKDVSEIRK